MKTTFMKESALMSTFSTVGSSASLGSFSRVSLTLLDTSRVAWFRSTS